MIRLLRLRRDLRDNLDYYERMLSAAVVRHQAGGFEQEYNVARGQLAMVQMFRRIVEDE